MIIVKWIVSLFFATGISLIIAIIYIKALSVLEQKYGKAIRALPLFQKICNPRTENGQDSKWEVKSIQYFDNSYHWLKSYSKGCIRVIRHFWSYFKNYYRSKRYYKNQNRNLESPLSHTSTPKVG